MPLYEYTCLDCDHPFEVLQPVGASAQGVSCPACRRTSVSRQHSTFAASTSKRSTPAPAAGGSCCMGTAA